MYQSVNIPADHGLHKHPGGQMISASDFGSQGPRFNPSHAE